MSGRTKESKEAEEKKKSVWLGMEFQIACFLLDPTYKLPNLKMAINTH